MNFEREINGNVLEYYDDGHMYLVDGVLVPSITSLIRMKSGDKYENVRKDILQRASEKGTEVHDAIESWCIRQEESDLPEVKNFRFLQKQYRFEVKDCEVPVILYMDGRPVSAGRLDLVLEKDGMVGLGDIKRTFALDKGYLMYQLNLYRIAYQQSYGVPVEFLKGIHLREDVRKGVDIPINESIVMDLVREVISE